MENKKLTPVFTILENSVSLWWQHLVKILKLYWEGIKPILIPLVVTTVSIVLGFLITDRFVSNLFKTLAGVSGFVSVIFMVYFLTRGYMAIFFLVKNDYKDAPKETYRETKPLFWPYIGLSLLTGLLIFLWALLLIIPAIIFSVFYSLAVYVLFFEGKRGMSAISRSKALVKGYFWPVFGRFCFLMLVVWLLMILLMAPIAGVPETSAWSMIWSGIIQIISWLISPIALFFSYSIYSDLVKIKDAQPQIKQ